MARKRTGIERALLERVKELTEQVAALTAKVGSLREENRQLREQLEQSQREAARQAAPFRRRDSKKKNDDQKKRPGRKAGHPGAGRPKPEQIDEHHEVRLDQCPHCGGAIEDVGAVVQYIEELPPLRPVVHQVVTYQGRCACCGTVRSVHPLQTSTRPGVQLGPRAAATAVMLNKQMGLTMRKTCRVLKALVGLTLTPGGLSQLADRLADRAADAYDKLVETIRQSPACNADETSWWVGRPGWWLWTFTTPQATVYRVESGRGGWVVRDTLGEHYGGVLGSDCLSSYDPIKCRKHKCISHHLKAIRDLDERTGRSTPYRQDWRLLFKTVVALHRLAVEGMMPPTALAEKRQRLQHWVDQLLAAPGPDPGDGKIHNRLIKQRRHLLTCLDDLHADPTNNAAERALRPAVIARKLSCGNKTERGKRTWEILVSLGQTAHQCGRDFIDELAAHAAIASPAS